MALTLKSLADYYFISRLHKWHVGNKTDTIINDRFNNHKRIIFAHNTIKTGQNPPTQKVHGLFDAA